MTELLNVILQSFWSWIGTTILVSIILYYVINGIVRICSSFIRVSMIKKYGWPPAHLDTNGDWKQEPKKNGRY